MLEGGRFWIIGAADLVLWIDKLFLKPLPKALPDYDHLLTHPADRLREGSIRIGSARRYSTATVLGLLVAIPSWMLIFAAFMSLLDPKKGPPATREDGPLLLTLLLAAMIAALIVSVLLMLRILRGGHMVLTSDGVGLWHGDSVVYCPWTLFNAPGHPYDSSGSGVRVPINPEALPLTDFYEAGEFVALGQSIRCRQLRFTGDCEAVLGALYVVKARDLAGLFLHLGRTLGVSLPEAHIEVENRLKNADEASRASNDLGPA